MIIDSIASNILRSSLVRARRRSRVGPVKRRNARSESRDDVGSGVGGGIIIDRVDRSRSLALAVLDNIGLAGKRAITRDASVNTVTHVISVSGQTSGSVNNETVNNSLTSETSVGPGEVAAVASGCDLRVVDSETNAERKDASTRVGLLGLVRNSRDKVGGVCAELDRLIVGVREVEGIVVANARRSTEGDRGDVALDRKAKAPMVPLRV